MQLQILQLYDKPEFISIIADIYMQEWSWHYADEWNIFTKEEMIFDLSNNLKNTYLAFKENDFIGTIAVLDNDLRSHTHLTPWIACLYVCPKYRNQGFGKQLMDYARSLSSDRVYLWCYTEREKKRYEKWGFKVIESCKYNNNMDAYVLSK